MKKGLISIGILIGFMLSILMVSGVFAKDVVEYTPAYGKVTFTHKKHAETLKIDCLKCHHTWKKGETTGKLCKDCHKASKEASKDGKGIAAKDAYHKDCKGCHEEAKKANKPAGPTGCTQCHVTFSTPKIDTIPKSLIITSNIDISVNIGSEIFPVFAKLFTEKSNVPGLIRWELANKGNERIKVSLISEIAEWTPPTITAAELSPNESKVVMQTPFGIKLLRNYTLVPSTLILKAKIEDRVIFEETRSVKIRAADDMIWGVNSPGDSSFLIAAWVTPKDPAVEKILSIAKDKRLLTRRLSGYQEPVEPQVRAIFNAVRDVGISYVSSPVNFGQVRWTQRVRLPRATISQRAANCIDGAVLFASLFENIDLQPLIILLPDHAFVGVRIAPGLREVLFIETTLVGRSGIESLLTAEQTFDAAVKAGNERFSKSKNRISIIDIKEQRKKGIYPLW